MRAPAAALLVLALLLPRPAGAEDGVESPAAPSGNGAPALLYLGLNRQGHEEWWRPRDGAVVIRIPGGEYLRRPYQGMAATEDPHPVAVGSFLMDKHEVTNGQFALFLNAAGGEVFGILDREVPGLVHEDGGWRAAPGMERLPVTCANGRGALAYARWAGARIPTADEWMKAAGGPEGLLYPWGEEPPDEARANFGLPEKRGLAPVGSRPLGASPYGCLDMAGNAYDRVLAPVRGGDGRRAGHPVMLKGASWASPNPLNLRVLDLCMQPAEVADRTVGFRCAMDDPEPDRAPRTAEARPTLRLAADFDAAVSEAKARGVPIFLSLLYDTCGQCDRTIAQCYRDPRFVQYCNENLVVVFGHAPGDAVDAPHPAGPGGACTIHTGLTCRQHATLFARGLEVVGSFRVSPGNFVLDPRKAAKGAGEGAILVPERALPKWGNAVEEYLRAFEEAGKAMGSGGR